MPCSPVVSYQYFGGTCCLHLGMVYGQTGYRYKERSKENDSVCNFLGGKGPKYLWGEKKTEKNVSRSQRHKKCFSGGNRVIHNFCGKELYCSYYLHTPETLNLFIFLTSRKQFDKISSLFDANLQSPSIPKLQYMPCHWFSTCRGWGFQPMKTNRVEGK